MTLTEAQCRAARSAGILYLLMAVTAPFALIYVPSKLVVTGDATATADRFRAAETLARAGIGVELFHQVLVIFVVLALYRLFKAVNERHAVQVVVLGALVSVPIVFVNVLNELAALALVGDAEFLSVIARPQRDALAYLFVRLHDRGLVVASIFWGLWLFPLGMLAIRSRFVPRILGVLLIIAGVGYLASSTVLLVFPRFADVVVPVASILYFGELPFIFWLVVWGFRVRPSLAPAMEARAAH